VAHCYSYTPKGGTEPEFLNVVDEKIAEHLGVPVHKTQWVENWDNVVSMFVASGYTLPEVRNVIVEWQSQDEFKTEEDQQHLANLIRICDFLDSNYVAQAWREMGFARR
jgi:hypothetical protein